MESNGDELSDRKKMILKAVIDAHIGNGEPVGSKYLTLNKQIAVSSATIRNEMAELESLGYLEQPHTSAGRIPSERGYRFYVNSLMQRYRLTSSELREIDNLASGKIAELDSIFDSATKLISYLTNYTSLSVKPRPPKVIIVCFKTVWLESETFLLVIITNTNVIKTKSIHSSFEVNEEQIKKFETVLNTYMTGVTMDKITLPLIMEMERCMNGCEALVSPVIKCIYEVISELDGGDIKIEGVNRLLLYPEYSDLERLREMLGLFESKDDILDLIAGAEKDTTNIYIGSENSVDIMHNSTLIFKTVMSGERIVGAIGVIGPCRMDYSKVITTVEYLARQISGMANDVKLINGTADKKKENENDR